MKRASGNIVHNTLTQTYYAPSPAVSQPANPVLSGFAPPPAFSQKIAPKACKRALEPNASMSQPNEEKYEAMVDKILPSGKRHKEEESFESQETNASTNREMPVVLLECFENLGVEEANKVGTVPPAVLTQPLPYQSQLLAEDNKEEAAPPIEPETPIPINPADLEVIGIDTLNYLVCREQAYSPDPYYMEKYQPDLTWTMRLILIDWIMEVCMEFQLKRETFHYSVNFIDRFLSLVPRVGKSELQLVGVTALYVAAKMEEVYVPKIQDFAKATDNGYTIDQIKKMEAILTKTLKWELAPPTLNMWGNWYMGQWDTYIQVSEYARGHVLIQSVSDPMVVFKLPNEKAYSRFRELTQLLDLVTLDIMTLRYHPRALVASALYVLLAFHFGQATIEEIVNQFPNGSLFINPQYPFNDLFSDFLRASFGFDLPELLPTIQYMSGFLALPFNYTVPQVKKYHPEAEVFLYKIINIGKFRRIFIVPNPSSK